MSKVLDAEQTVVAINPGLLRDEFVAFPGLLSAFGERYAVAVSKAAALKEQLKDVEAEVYLELRAQKEAGTRGDSEKTIEARVRVDRRVKMTRDLWLAAEADKTRLYEKVMSPLYAKKDMLVSIGAHQRAELSGDPMVKHARRDDVAELEEKLYG